jgi:hypothetical protein
MASSAVSRHCGIFISAALANSHQQARARSLGSTVSGDGEVVTGHAVYPRELITKICVGEGLARRSGEQLWLRQFDTFNAMPALLELPSRAQVSGMSSAWMPVRISMPNYSL